MPVGSVGMMVAGDYERANRVCRYDGQLEIMNGPKSV
jgi:hypothetical protein